jgi:hypothetical protein
MPQWSRTAEFRRTRGTPRTQGKPTTDDAGDARRDRRVVGPPTARGRHRVPNETRRRETPGAACDDPAGRVAGERGSEDQWNVTPAMTGT